MVVGQPILAQNGHQNGGCSIGREGRVGKWDRSKHLILDIDDQTGLIGWSGYDEDHSGIRRLGTMGIGVPFFGLSEIASWLARGIQAGTVQGDGPTSG